MLHLSDHIIYAISYILLLPIVINIHIKNYRCFKINTKHLLLYHPCNLRSKSKFLSL